MNKSHLTLEQLIECVRLFAMFGCPGPDDDPKQYDRVLDQLLEITGGQS